MSLSKRILYNLNVTGGRLLSNDIDIRSGTISNIYLGNVSGGSIILSGNLSVGGTLTTVNITTTNISETNISASNVVATNVTIANILNTNNMIITNLSSGSVVVSGNATFGSNVLVAGPILQIPIGNIVSRPNTPTSGYIRYNTETSQFEGYGPGNAWGSLGGVVDIAQTTKILASANPSVTDGNLYFYTVGSERVRINSAGNIGIGTTSPGATLDVTGTVRVTTSITTGAVYATNSTVTNITSASAQITNANITTLTAATLLNTNQNSTNVSASTLNLSTGVTAATARITTNLLAIGNSNTIGNIFTTGGNVGIGTVFPVAPLHVVGTTSAISTTAGGIFMGTFTDNNTFIQLNSTTGSYIDFSGNGNDYKGRILYNNASDYMDFSTNTISVARMDSVGNLTMTGDITAFGSISDRRLKENIVNIPLDIALDKVKGLRPVTFTWQDTIQNKVRRGTSDAGFIAQEVEEVIEYAVGEFDDIVSGERYKKLNHERIIPYLVAALQEMDERLQQERLLHQETISDLQDTKQKLINLINIVSELVGKIMI